VGNAALPQPDVDSGGREQRGSEHGVAFTAGEPQVEQGVLWHRLDLGREHAGGRAPRLTVRRAPVHHEHAPPGHRQFARASGSYGAGADYDNIKYGSHLYSDETI
jgi:hypothetical protein